MKQTAIEQRILDRLQYLAILCCLVSGMAGFPAAPCMAYPPDKWDVHLRVANVAHRYGFTIGAYPGFADGYEGGWVDVSPDDVGAYVLEYHENGADWQGPTGFYTWSYESPIPPGGTKTWDIYMWAQNYTPDPPHRIDFGTGTGDYDMIPFGYTGHLVLDYVPESANWTGPMEFWLDLGVFNTFTLPIVTVTDPLDGIRMHITVYAPIPEPCSLAALGFGVVLLARLGLCVRRRE